MIMEGRARDAVTVDPRSRPVVVDEDHMNAVIGPFRTIESLDTNVDHPGIARLVGCRGGGHLRAALDEHVPDQRAAGTPLALLLDDISGASLVGAFVWSRWSEDWGRPAEGRRDTNPMEGVCIGFAPGNSSLQEMSEGLVSHRVQVVVPLENPDDPDGFHHAPVSAEITMRRARWIDVWRDDDGDRPVVRVASGFQDSTTDPDPDIYKVAVHEYLVSAVIDPASMILADIAPDARVLPFRECPRAVDTAKQLIGTPVPDLRRAVLDKLSKTNGCTHLNDAMRALAEVPVLLAHLDRALA